MYVSYWCPKMLRILFEYLESSIEQFFIESMTENSFFYFTELINTLSVILRLIALIYSLHFKNQPYRYKMKIALVYGKLYGTYEPLFLFNSKWWHVYLTWPILGICYWKEKEVHMPHMAFHIRDCVQSSVSNNVQEITGHFYQTHPVLKRKLEFYIVN